MHPELSVVIPVCNEAPNVEPLTREIVAALAGRAVEIIYVDDGSSDDTAAVVRALSAGVRGLRLLRHARRSGQSAALCTGMAAARAPWVATLDGDGQNDPADIPHLLAARERSEHAEVRLFIGHRRARRDTWLRRLASRVANAVRGRLLGDRTPDTGCGLKLIHRESFQRLPQFDHMHRFLPALVLRAGLGVMSVPVSHRPRARGVSKYGVLDRLGAGIVDLLGMLWLSRRKMDVEVLPEGRS